MNYLNEIHEKLHSSAIKKKIKCSCPTIYRRYYRKSSKKFNESKNILSIEFISCFIHIFNSVHLYVYVIVNCVASTSNDLFMFFFFCFWKNDVKSQTSATAIFPSSPDRFLFPSIYCHRFLDFFFLLFGSTSFHSWIICGSLSFSCSCIQSDDSHDKLRHISQFSQKIKII